MTSREHKRTTSGIIYSWSLHFTHLHTSSHHPLSSFMFFQTLSSLTALCAFKQVPLRHALAFQCQNFLLFSCGVVTLQKKEHSNYLKPSGHEKIRAFARNSVYLALGCIGSGQHTHATMPKMKLGSCRHRFSWCSCGKKVRLKLWQLGSSAETIGFRLQTDDPIPHWDIHFACWVRQVQNIGKKWQEPDLQCACCMSKEPCPSFPRPIALRWSLWCPCQKTPRYGLQTESCDILRAAMFCHVPNMCPSMCQI